MKTARQVEDAVRAAWPDGGTIAVHHRGKRWALTSETFRKDGTRIGYWAQGIVSAESPDALLRAFRLWLLGREIAKLRAAGLHPAAVVLSDGVRRELGANGQRLNVVIPDGERGSLDWTVEVMPANGAESTMRVLDALELAAIRASNPLV